MQFHMKRIMEWYQSIQHGQLLPLFSFNYYHGSAVMSMYPYLIMLPFILLIKITSSVIVSYYIFFILIVFSSLLISYFSSLRYSKSILISYIFSITYSMSSVFIFKMFTDGDIGVATSLVFLPLVIFGFLDILNGSNNYLKIALGITLMSFCQIAAVLIIILFLILWFIVNLMHINKHVFFDLSKAGIITFLLTSIIWIPLLKISSSNRINTVVKTYLDGYSLKFFMENLSLFPIITLVAGLIAFKGLKYYDKQIYLLAVLVVLGSSKLIPWKLVTSLPFLSFLNQFQFTYRFLIIPQILLSYVFSLIAYRLIKSSNKSRMLSLLLISLIIIAQIMTQSAVVYRKSHTNNMYFNNLKDVKIYESHNKPKKYNGYLFNNNESMKYFVEGFIPNRDYYPKSSNNVDKYIHNYKGIYGNHHTINIDHYGYNKFMFHNSKDIKRLALPLLHYNNEHLHVYLNHHLVHYQTNKNSLITLNNVNNGENRVKVQYVPNILLVILKSILFLLGLLWLIIVLIKSHVRKRINY